MAAVPDPVVMREFARAHESARSDPDTPECVLERFETATRDGFVRAPIFKGEDLGINYLVNAVGIVRNCHTGHAKQPHLNDDGYWRYQLSIEGRYVRIGACELVLRAFVGPPPTEAYTVDHIDQVRTNDAVSNLRWLTQRNQSFNTTRKEDTRANWLPIISTHIKSGARQSWDSVKAASVALDIQTQVIINVLSGKNKKTRSGYSFEVDSEKVADLPGEVWGELTIEHVKAARERKVCAKKLKHTQLNDHGRERMLISSKGRRKRVHAQSSRLICGPVHARELGRQNGYPAITAFGVTMKMHVAVAFVFLDKPSNWRNTIIHHIDGDKTNCDVTNLSWSTESENASAFRATTPKNRVPQPHAKPVVFRGMNFTSIRDAARWYIANVPGAAGKDIGTAAYHVRRECASS